MYVVALETRSGHTDSLFGPFDTQAEATHWIEQQDKLEVGERYIVRSLYPK
jgi:hypothetical protein